MRARTRVRDVEVKPIEIEINGKVGDAKIVGTFNGTIEVPVPKPEPPIEPEPPEPEPPIEPPTEPDPGAPLAPTNSTGEWA